MSRVKAGAACSERGHSLAVDAVDAPDVRKALLVAQLSVMNPVSGWQVQGDSPG
jgi:hypothetical protein